MGSPPDVGALPFLQVGGFGASVDAFAWEPDPDVTARRVRLWFVSLLGSQQAVKAVWARLLKGELASLSHESTGHVQFCTLATEGPRAWRSFTASLPAAAAYHLVLVPDAARYAAALDAFLLVLRSAEEAPLLHFRFLDRRLDLPLHVSWCQWLWDRALRTGEAVPLEAEGITAYRCAPDAGALQRDVSAAIQGGALAVPGDVELTNNAWLHGRTAVEGQNPAVQTAIP